MTDFQNQKERIITFIKSIQLSNSAFERSLGLSNGYINSMRKGLGYEKLEQLSKTYPVLNMGWLLTGEGPMLKSTDLAQLTQSDTQTCPSTVMIPFEEYKKAIAEKDEEIKDLSRRIGMLEHELQVFASQKQTALGTESATGVAIHRNIPEAE